MDVALGGGRSPWWPSLRGLVSAPVSTELCSVAILAALQEEDRTDISLIIHTLLPSDLAKPSGQITKGSDINSVAPFSLFNLQNLRPDRLDQGCSLSPLSGPWWKAFARKPREASGQVQMHTSQRHGRPSVTQPEVGPARIENWGF